MRDTISLYRSLGSKVLVDWTRCGTECGVWQDSIDNVTVMEGFEIPYHKVPTTQGMRFCSEWARMNQHHVA
jgi:hypothetical protein